MGFFDKVKHFAGGHGVKVTHTEIERQPLPVVSLPLADTVVKGKFRVTADKPCDVLSMRAQFVLEYKHPDGREETIVLGADEFPSPNCSRSDEMQKYPYALASNAAVEDFFIISMEQDIPSTLSAKGLTLDRARFYVKTMVDVKGSPFDPEAKDPVEIVA